MKLFNLILVTLLSVAVLTGCGGGGGGGGNPAGPAADPLTDYPTIAASYVAMQSALEDNTSTSVARVALFMNEIADDFVAISNTGSRAGLENTTKNRLDIYNIVNYSFTPLSHTVKDGGDTIEVDTYMKIVVVKKDPNVGNALDNTPYEIARQKIIWKKYGAVYKVYSGLPYLSEEIGM